MMRLEMVAPSTPISLTEDRWGPSGRRGNVIDEVMRQALHVENKFSTRTRGHQYHDPSRQRSIGLCRASKYIFELLGHKLQIIASFGTLAIPTINGCRGVVQRTSAKGEQSRGQGFFSLHCHGKNTSNWACFRVLVIFIVEERSQRREKRTITGSDSRLPLRDNLGRNYN